MCTIIVSRLSMQWWNDPSTGCVSKNLTLTNLNSKETFEKFYNSLILFILKCFIFNFVLVMRHDDHFPIVGFVWWAFLYSVRFLLTHPVYTHLGSNLLVQGLHPLLLKIHLRVDVGQLPPEPLHPGLGQVDVRLEQVGVILSAGSRTRGAHWN